MTLLDPRLWLALIIALAGAYGVGRYHQAKSDKAEHTAQLLKATQQAREKEQEWQLIYKETTDAKEAQLRAVALERDAALAASMRERAKRLPEASRAACAGATGRELSDRDAAAFIGLAARAERIRIALDACQKREALGITPP